MLRLQQRPVQPAAGWQACCHQDRRCRRLLQLMTVGFQLHSQELLSLLLLATTACGAYSAFSVLAVLSLTAVPSQQPSVTPGTGSIIGEWQTEAVIEMQSGTGQPCHCQKKKPCQVD